MRGSGVGERGEKCLLTHTLTGRLQPMEAKVCMPGNWWNDPFLVAAVARGVARIGKGRGA